MSSKVVAWNRTKDVRATTENVPPVYNKVSQFSAVKNSYGVTHQVRR